MKKLHYTFVLSCTLFVSECEPKSVSKINKGVKVIGKCCKELSAGKQKHADALKEEEGKLDTDHNVSSILPSYFWDAKSMIW
jgi:hypothetical protein